jgi:hypothetical protein
VVTGGVVTPDEFDVAADAHAATNRSSIDRTSIRLIFSKVWCIRIPNVSVYISTNLTFGSNFGIVVEFRDLPGPATL